jgi:hypothetical protein
MLPPDLFANPQFSAANVVTLVVYAALGAVFFFLVVDLQIVAGFSPLLAGTALLPVTAIMLLLSERRFSACWDAWAPAGTPRRSGRPPRSKPSWSTATSATCTPSAVSSRMANPS